MKGERESEKVNEGRNEEVENLMRDGCGMLGEREINEGKERAGRIKGVMSIDRATTVRSK